MVGMDLDSLTGHWATQGPNLGGSKDLLRPLGEIRAQRADQYQQRARGLRGPWLAKLAHAIFPQEIFAEGEALLDSAAAAAASNEGAAG